ncbi:MAG: signal peptidase I [Burkholderiaceae bacterium]|jgi:signal peptidase I|nr:signal peptidase I [Burkholderiaceae bacterium]
MPLLTSLILACFAGYGTAWYMDFVDGNFELLLLAATVVTGLYWLAERLFFLPCRRAAAQMLQTQDAQRRAELAAKGITQVDGDVTAAREKLLAQPWWLDWTAGLFPVILIVFALRSFVFEPFKIPSSSMEPTLLVGDLILVNKFTYGLKLPVLGTRITGGNSLQRGDVVVFRFPPKPSENYIKRVVGLPGDEVRYLNKQLTINGQPMPQVQASDFFNASTMGYSKQLDEQLGPVRHRVLVNDSHPAMVTGADQFQYRDQCTYSAEGFVCKVPPGRYFMMGDNRDNSLDSRYWGFVPDANIVGRAFFVWMNFSDVKRIGSFN